MLCNLGSTPGTRLIKICPSRLLRSLNNFIKKLGHAEIHPLTVVGRPWPIYAHLAPFKELMLHVICSFQDTIILKCNFKFSHFWGSSQQWTDFSSPGSLLQASFFIVHHVLCDTCLAAPGHYSISCRQALLRTLTPSMSPSPPIRGTPGLICWGRLV